MLNHEAQCIDDRIDGLIRLGLDREYPFTVTFSFIQKYLKRGTRDRMPCDSLLFLWKQERRVPHGLDDCQRSLGQKTRATLWLLQKTRAVSSKNPSRQHIHIVGSLITFVDYLIVD